ncbi:MAG: putative lipid II flippase FtsW [Actinobacteria bacterium]|nr:MAG: putative lipid II flippase FtsW [Actinomycetota bacterium]
MSAKHPATYAGGPQARYLMLGSALFLTVFGLVMIYSASSITASVREGSPWHFLVRQAIFVGLGATVAFFVSRYDYRKLRDRAALVWAACVGMLLLTLVIGAVRGGARRWIPLGLFNLQPSELAKIGCILLVSALAVEWMRGRTEDTRFYGSVAIATGVPAILIILQPDFGTTLTLAVAVALVLILAGIEWKWVVGSGLGVVVVGGLLVFTSEYRMRRVLGFLDPWSDSLGKGYQTIQALLAFGTGGIDGVGLGLSRQKFFYLPEAHTDFILAIIGEEAGLIGTIAVVAGLALFVYAGFRIAVGAKDPFGRLVAGAITGMLAFQAFLNMAAVTGVMPVTGKPLPFVSYGGSSMLVTMICLGLLLSVSEYGARAPQAVRQSRRSEEPRREGDRERRGNRGTHLSRVDGSRGARRRA